MKKHLLRPGLLLPLLLLLLAACGEIPKEETHGPQWSDLSATGTIPLEYAQEFTLEEYGVYTLLSIPGDGSQFLLVPEGEEVPQGLGDIVPLCQPLEGIYLVSSAALDFFRACGGMDALRFSSLKAEGWYIPEAKARMEAGTLLYAGRYAAPDYERLRAEGCDLAVENTMLYHAPQVREELTALGIPVLVDRSSYETTPQGRMEWCKLYGLLTGHWQAGVDAFQAQRAVFDQVEALPPTGKTVAFFSVNTNGGVVVRRGTDYVAKMLDMAGGEYLFRDLTGPAQSHTSTLTLPMEDFYLAAKEADVLIYNSTIEGQLYTLEDFLDKSPLFPSLKGVETGQVYCTTADLYQSAMSLGDFLTDLRQLLEGEREGLTFLNRLE